jgi:O-succinylbenzoate synthase
VTSNVTIRHVRVPFRTPFATAAGEWTARESWIVVVRGPDGRVGIGEALGGDDAALAGAVAAAELDLSAAPLVALGRNGPGVGVNATLPGLDPLTTAQVARMAVAAGYRTLKLKAGARDSLGELVVRVASVRDAVGDAIALRLDANGTWLLDEATARLEALARYGLQYVEQPMAPRGSAALDEAAELRRRVGVAVRVAADEAVASLADARLLLEAGAADVLVVKPGRVGGPVVVADIARLAAEHGVPVVISSMFETGVGLAAGLRCAALLPDVPGWPAAERDHGLATADLLVDDLLVEPLAVDRGRMRVPGGPGSGGLGVVLDEAAMARYDVAS